MANNKVIFGGRTLIDITPTTATETDVAQGKIFFKADGSQATGVSSGVESQKIYCGESTPSSSLGENGDVYIHTSSGGTLEVYPADYTASNFNSTSNLGQCIGVSAEDGTSTSNAYSSGQSATGVANYTFDLSSLPSNVTITSVSCDVKAHEENASRSSCVLQLYSGNTAKGSVTTVNGTSNTIYSLSTGSWTRAELDNLTLRLSVGYYGGLIAGATLVISYEMTTSSYEVKLSGDSSSWSLTGDGIYKKSNGSWSSVSSVTLDTIIEKS